MAAPVVVLVETSLAENLGGVARVMANFGARDLRLVAPGCAPDELRARRAATSGEGVLADATVHADLDAAIGDCVEAWAAASPGRAVPKPVLGPRLFAERVVAGGGRVALVLGPERTGLRSAHLDRCTGLVVIPTEADARALNLAQAAGVLLWEWRAAAQASLQAPVAALPAPAPAPLAAQHAAVDHVVAALLAAGWLQDPTLRQKAVRSLRAVALRAGLTTGELRALRGAVVALARRGPGTN